MEKKVKGGRAQTAGGKGRERKPVGRQWIVGTISADACSYAVRVLLSLAQRFLRDSCVRYHRVQHSLNAETQKVEGRDAGRKNARMRKGRREGRTGRVLEEGEKRSRTSPPQGHGPPTTFTRCRSYEVVQLG